jgi:hypothetical protein
VQENYLVAEKLANGEHAYVTLRTKVGSEWLGYLADEYIRLRTETVVPIVPISLDEITVVDITAIQQRLASANVPQRNRGKGNFDVVRSDLGETVAIVFLRDHFGMKLVYTGIRDRELANLPGRGPDTFGVEDGEQLAIVIGEVKVSNEGSSPPSVVDISEDCLSVQHRTHMTDLKKTADKLWHMSRLCRNLDIQRLAHAALLYLEKKKWDKVRVVAFSLLVRPQDKHTAKDFGSFQSSPQKYAPAKVRFTAFCVPDEIEALADKWGQMLAEKVQ